MTWLRAALAMISSVASDGDDFVAGGAGNDVAYGGAGNDIMFAGAGDSGDDVYFGDSGNDQIGGGAGNDILFGGSGVDTLFGGSGDDILWNNNNIVLLTRRMVAPFSPAPATISSLATTARIRSALVPAMTRRMALTGMTRTS